MWTVLFLGATLQVYAAPNTESVAAEGTEAPPRTRPPLPDSYAPAGLDGVPVDFRELRGKPVMVSLWASWCQPCIQELPEIAALKARYEPRGLKVVGIAVDDPPGRARAAVKKHGIDWPVALDSGERASKLFLTDELPTTVLYQPDGTTAWSHMGPIKADDPVLNRVLEKLMPTPEG